MGQHDINATNDSSQLPPRYDQVVTGSNSNSVQRNSSQGRPGSSTVQNQNQPNNMGGPEMSQANQAPQPGMPNYSYSSNTPLETDRFAKQQQPSYSQSTPSYNPAIASNPNLGIPPGASSANPIPVAWNPGFACAPVVPMGGQLYWYRNAAGQTFSTPYPPDHPYMECIMSSVGHVPRTYHGCLGVVMGCLFFPFGCIWTALDFQTRCKRCGQVLDTGCYSE